ncbi:MAG: hypothetical protein JST73_09435, partial [Actinobacteria bacterium]|nr:hypothetical protein [Actinomycetota bacterium]
NAGGLIAPRDPAKTSQASTCFVLLKATSSGFQVVKDPTLAPSADGNGVFNCGVDNVATVGDQPLMLQYQHMWQGDKLLKPSS